MADNAKNCQNEELLDPSFCNYLLAQYEKNQAILSGKNFIKRSDVYSSCSGTGVGNLRMVCTE